MSTKTYRIERLSVARLTSIFAGGNIISLALSMVAGLLVARFTEPADLGLFNSIFLLQGYLIFLQLGVLNGLNRQLPFYIGRGDKETAESYAAASQAWALFLGILVGLSILCIATWHAIQGNWQYAIGYTVLAFSTFSFFFATHYLQITYRTRGDFARLSGINFSKSIISLVSVFSVVYLGYYGLCLRNFLSEVSSFILLWKWRPLRIKPIWNLNRLIDLIKVGAPIFVSGQLYAWWTVLNSTNVLLSLNTRALGLYQLAVISGSAIEIFYSSLSQIIYPRMAEAYGQKEDINTLISMARRPIIYIVILTIPLVLIGWYLLPPAVRLFLPKYQEAISTAQWTLLAVTPLSFLPLNNLFAVVKRVDFYIISIAIGMGVYYIVFTILFHQKPTLDVFPKALLIGRSVMIGLSLLFINYLQNKSARFETKKL